MKLKVSVTLTEEMLGTKPADKEVFATYVASKAPDGDKRKEELESAEHVEEQGTTIFHKDEAGVPYLWDYQIKGYMKDACQSLRKADGTLSKRLKAYQTLIDGLIFVFPRQIKIKLPVGFRISHCERALRVNTMQGPRVCLARSETVPRGSKFEFEVTSLAKKFGKDDGAVDAKELLIEWFNYSQLRGFGQWRNSGKGRAVCQIEEIE